MKILILTRNLDVDNKNNGSAADTHVYGRENLEDVIAIKKALGANHEIKSLPVNKNIYYQIKAEKPEMVFNLCDDGFWGDYTMEPHIPILLDILNIPYTGNGYFTLALCQNKVRAKDVLTYNKILTPKFQVFTAAERKVDPELKYPLIVKPIREDGSVGIRERSVVENEAQLKEEVAHIVKFYNQEALVEEFIDGREFNVSLIGNKRPIVLPISEIDFSGMPEHLPNIVSYRAKWVKQSIEYKKTPVKCPANVDEKITKTVEETARKCYKIFGCRGYVRIDFRYHEKENKLYVLEINPNPDISQDAGLTRSAGVAGISYADLLQKIIDFGMEKRY
jgi:D-alanine-D-alanine ligase